MSKEEKKALRNFLFIYVMSTLFLVSVIFYIYYTKGLKMAQQYCNMELKNTSMQIKVDILDNYINNKNFTPKKLQNENTRYALLDKDKNVIFSNLDDKFEIDYSKNLYENSHYNYYINTLNEINIPIKYIVMESSQVFYDRNDIKILMLVKLIISFLFIACIGYLLSRILLNPARKRVESMDKFIKDSAHELNTPVSVLMTSVSMLKNGKNPQKMMKYILSSSKQISQIYNDIHFSAFNEINEDVFEEFDLKDLVAESVDYFNDISITKNVQINSNLDSCFIKMDRTKTQKLVNNLISNSIKYSYKDSEIEVTLKNDILCIKDFGIGISQEEQKEIFKRYKRGNNNEGGFGIGLDIVKRICDEYNLNIDIKSEKGKETQFSVYFSSIVNKK